MSKPTQLSLKDFDGSWTLLLDRDGVLNHQKEGGYILNWEEFIFYEDVLDAMPLLAKLFNKIFIITNQRGVGKGLMTEDALQQLHLKMQAGIETAGGRIDGIYYCTAVDTAHGNRKPNTGMAMQLKEDFPAVDFSRSIMVGNSPGDIVFGERIGAFTVFLTTTSPAEKGGSPGAIFASLADFTAALPPLR